MKFSFYFLAILFCIASPAFQAAQAQSIGTTSYPEVTFSGTVRYRSELDGRFFDFNARPLHYDLLRTQIGATVKFSKDILLVTKLQDARNFGEEDATQARGTLDGTAKNFGLREGYVLWNNFLTEGLSVKFGRMIFGTNNMRIIGSLEWNNIGRSYDGNIIAYKAAEKTQIRAFAFKLGNDELYMTQAKAQQSQTLFGADIDLPWQDKLNLYCYYDRNATPLLRGPDAGAAQLTRGTTGFYIKNATGDFEYEIEASHQLGSCKTTDSTARADINANVAAAFVSYKAQKDLSVGIGCDFYTGNDKNTPEENESFEHLFITGHQFYGFMDFFPSASMPTTGQRKSPEFTGAGLIMPYLKSTYIYDEKLSFQIWAMMFNAQLPIAGTTSKNIGAEIDINAYYKFQKNVKFEAGFGTFLPGEATKTTNPSVGMGTDPSYWGYVMFTLDW
ncbi:hypothetical protein MASR2M18_17660 [Ignavibacteria bacterium]|nr:alginate export family protein [Bacteroidota bacterium]MCZ2132866.1 alginate export family protein [Bacteroidota bacterium]